jgi:predicted  nucleic acid-binding Zn-ribbon protein
LADEVSKLSDNVGKTYATKTELNNAVTEINGDIDAINNKIGTTAIAGATVTASIKALESDMTTAKSDISGLKTKSQNNADAIEKHTSDISGLTGRMSSAENTISGHTTTLAGLNTTVSGHTTQLGTHTTQISTLNTNLGKANTAIAANEDAIEALGAVIGDDNTAGTVKGRIKALEGDVSTAKSDISTAKSDISGLKTRMGTAEGNITTLQGDVDKAEADIKDIKDNIELLATKAEVEEVEETLQKNINDHIKAANAMTYKGGVDGVVNKLPTSNVKIGDTYVVTDAFNGYLPGDLLIAKGTEGDDFVITSGLSWDRVITGYDSYLNPSLKAAGNNIQLVDYTGSNEIGAVKLATDASNTVTITTDADNNTINLSIQWGTF